MIDYYDIPFIVTDKAGIDDESEFNALIENACGADESKQHAFMCKWIQEWLQKNDLQFVLAEIWDENEMAEFMCFAADYIEAFDYHLQDMISNHAYSIGGKKIEAAEQKIIQANLRQKNSAASKPAFADVMNIKEETFPNYEVILNEELQTLTREQLLELLLTVFGNDEYDETVLPEIEDCISFFTVILDENGWSQNAFAGILDAIQTYKAQR